MDIKEWVDSWLGRLRQKGIQVESFPLTVNPPAHQFYWPELDARWRRGDKALLLMYEDLALTLENYDVFVNWNGINVHPDFVQQLPTFNVYGCFDDPEASEILSKPVAWAYDLAMVGNIAELDTYKDWGVKEVRHWPLGFRETDYNPDLTHEKILSAERDIDIALLCERQTKYRTERLDKFTTAFPQGVYYGKGWPNGFLPEEQKVPIYQRTKIGTNFHNSTGPINFRTFILPANGVLQVCDNKSHLGKLFDLNSEVVGFDTLEEAVELCRYYLAHDEERRKIAAAGWTRVLKDYNEVAVFRLMEQYVKELQPISSKKKNENVRLYLKRYKRKNKLFYLFFLSKRLLSKAYDFINKYIRKLNFRQ